MLNGPVRQKLEGRMSVGEVHKAMFMLTYSSQAYVKELLSDSFGFLSSGSLIGSRVPKRRGRSRMQETCRGHELFM